MNVNLAYGRGQLNLAVPDDAVVYSPHFPEPAGSPSELVMDAVRDAIASTPLEDAARVAEAGSAVVVVSDITRPIPYHAFLAGVLAEIESGGIPRGQITVLIATGMHRPSTEAERCEMFGENVCRDYRIVDHRADAAGDLVTIPGRSRSGRPIELNRHFVEADFKVVTGLAEPHFMAGFSGGRKAVCPGLCSLNTVKAFHGYEFLADPGARNVNLEGNPLHEESLSIARAAGVDFCLNVVANGQKEIVGAFAGDMEASHEAACRLVRRCASPAVERECDVVLTSSGGYPLDATFYQCVKGLVSCLPAVKTGGAVLAVGACSEGMGSPGYRQLMYEYAQRPEEFLAAIREREDIVKDQWELQMQVRAMEHAGPENLFFLTDGLPDEDLAHLGMAGIDARGKDVAVEVQRLLNEVLADGRSLAVIPEGPYCAPEPGSACR